MKRVEPPKILVPVVIRHSLCTSHKELKMEHGCTVRTGSNDSVRFAGALDMIRSLYG